MPDKPPLVPVEVVPPLPGGTSGNGRAPHSGAPTPFHPASAALLLVVDNLWMLPEFAVVDWWLTIPASFLSVAGPVYWIQRRKSGDGRVKAALKALFLGVVAAVPLSVTGTPVGLALLAWFGIKKLNP